MEVREAERRDVSEICRLLALLFEQEVEFAASYERQERAVYEIVENPECGRFLVLEHEGIIIGSVSVLFVPTTALGGSAALLEDMIIKPEMRGSGFGELLLRKAIKFAREHGCLRITLLTDQDNMKAQRLYKKHGFVESKMLPMRIVFEEMPN